MVFENEQTAKCLDAGMLLETGFLLTFIGGSDELGLEIQELALVMKGCKFRLGTKSQAKLISLT